MSAPLKSKRVNALPFVIIAVVVFAFVVWPTLYQSTGTDAAGNPARRHRFTGVEEVKVPGAEGWIDAEKYRNLVTPPKPDPLNLVDKFNKEMEARDRKKDQLPVSPPPR